MPDKKHRYVNESRSSAVAEKHGFDVYFDYMRLLLALLVNSMVGYCSSGVGI